MSRISAGERSVYSPSGRPMFSASVIELHSAPPWNNTPKLRSFCCRSSSLDFQKGTPS